MPRPPRSDFPGAWHHVMNRGARRAPVFETSEHASLFLHYVGEAAERVGIEIHAYSVMPNHFHLLIHSPQGTLSRGMQRIAHGFTVESNRRLGYDGPVFRGRFKSQLIADTPYLLTAASYIHLNPIRAKLARRLDHRCWTSHRAYLGLEAAPDWLRCDTLLDLAGGAESFSTLVQNHRHHRSPWPADFDSETGWRKLPPGSSKPKPLPRPFRSKGPSTKQILKTIQTITGMKSKDLQSSRYGRHGHREKRLAVWALAQKTTLTHREIGELLSMSSANVGVTLGRLGDAPKGVLKEWMEAFENRLG